LVEYLNGEAAYCAGLDRNEWIVCAFDDWRAIERISLMTNAPVQEILGHVKQQAGLVSSVRNGRLILSESRVTRECIAADSTRRTNGQAELARGFHRISSATTVSVEAVGCDVLSENSNCPSVLTLHAEREVHSLRGCLTKADFLKDEYLTETWAPVSTIDVLVFYADGQRVFSVIPPCELFTTNYTVYSARDMNFYETLLMHLRNLRCGIRVGP